MIGTSLSSCVKDIVEGRVSIDDVDLIIAGTKCVTEDDWIAVFNQYSQTFWKGISLLCEETVHTLRRRGKIVQPRVEGKDPLCSCPHWRPSRSLDLSQWEH